MHTLCSVLVYEHRTEGALLLEVTSQQTEKPVYMFRVHVSFSCDDYHLHYDMHPMGSVEYIHM